MRPSDLGSDEIVNKQMGDGLMAIFNFPIKIERHAEAAVKAALEIQQRCGAALAELAASRGEAAADTPGVGVGVHTGQVEIGEFSTFRSDFTAIGGAVNLAARLEIPGGGGRDIGFGSNRGTDRGSHGRRRGAEFRAQGHRTPGVGSGSVREPLTGRGYLPLVAAPVAEARAKSPIACATIRPAVRAPNPAMSRAAKNSTRSNAAIRPRLATPSSSSIACQ